MRELQRIPSCKCAMQKELGFRQGLKSLSGILGAYFKPIAGCSMIQTPLAARLEISEQSASGGLRSKW